METKVEIGKKAKAVIKWKVRPVDYSKEEAHEIEEKFSRKYGIPRERVSVDPVFIKKAENGDIVPYTNEVTSNIQEPAFQQKLFKEYIDVYEIKDCDMEGIIRIDNSINSLIDYEKYDAHKKYTLKWIKWDNFMSYGEDNFFDFTSLKGLVLLSSEPANQGGKTTFCIDLFRFLLFGKVTSREDNWTLSKAFNRHLKDATEVRVEGCITIDGTDYVIKRTLTRPSSKKRTEKSKITQKLNYYRVAGSEEIELVDDECLDGSSVKETNTSIKEAIGNERDFDLMISVSSDNLKGLISLKDTERGRLIARWIGLLPLEEKEKLAKEKFSKDVFPSLLMNKYSKEEVKTEIMRTEEMNDELGKTISATETTLKEAEGKLDTLIASRDTLLSSKREVDDKLSNADVASIQNNMEEIVLKGKEKREEKRQLSEYIEKAGNIEFNENEYQDILKVATELTSSIAVMRNECKSLKSEISSLKSSEFCPTCGARLKGVDNTKLITEKTKKYDDTVDKGKKDSALLEKVNESKTKMETLRTEYNTLVRKKLMHDKVEVDIENLASRYRECQRTLKDIEDNKDAIANNNRIKTSLQIVDATIAAEKKSIESFKNDIMQAKATKERNLKNIDELNKISEKISDEEKLVANWRLYLDMIGKNGISKLVIRNVLPIINGQLKNILDGVCDFDVEVVIDDRNDVAFNLIHDGITDSLASGSGFEQTVASLALRSVLSQISSFSKPSFVVFDEVLGGVSDENYECVKKLYDKIVKDYDFIFQVTHLKAIADWHNYRIVVAKENNISRIRKIE